MRSFVVFLNTGMNGEGVKIPDRRLGGVDKGWLVDESELQVQLISSPNLQEHSIHLLHSSQACSILPEAFSTSSPLLPSPRVVAKVLSRETLRCEVLGEEKVRYPPEESCGVQILVYSTRSPSFSDVVSSRTLIGPNCILICHASIPQALSRDSSKLIY